MRRLLDKIKRDKLLDFLVEYAQNDAKFANAINVRFGKPIFEEELDKIENEIDSALDGVADYRSHDRWGNAIFNTSDIIAEIRQRCSQGHIRLAFAETELLYRKLLKLFEYQGECEISDEAWYCISIMSDIADKAVSADDKEFIFQHCIGMSEIEDGKNYGADYESELLKIAAKFVTAENRMELENILAGLESVWQEEEFKLIHLKIIQVFDGEAAVDCFVAENLRFPKIREVAFDKAIMCGNFSEAERLCVDVISSDNQHFGVSPWLYKLYSVYEQSGNETGMAETAKSILLSGDLEYYEKLKSLIERQKTWDELYPTLLNELASALHYINYMEILQKEDEHVLLLEQLKKHSDQVYRHGKFLAEKYPTVVCDLFTNQLKREAHAAHKRDLYREVCSHIEKFSDSGYKNEATELIKELKDRYKRKPAFVDELTKI